ncbi:MAG: NAD-dependent epimerase/dehydratase family protein [Verrucomicrobia bacterium]|nr:NAD-dependent epimerase/dehydratase family protein [Verrucomicrobiota bacterium]
MTNCEVLVTGARGFLGWHVARELLRAGCKVRGVTRSLGAPLPEKDPGICWFEADITRPDTLAEPLRDCRYVFHVAGDYRFWSTETDEIYRNNVQGTVNVLEAACRAGVEKVVYTSTCGILAPRKQGEQNEAELMTADQAPGPYKRSKLLAYHEVQQRCRHGWPIVSVLPTAVIGPGDQRPTPTGRILVDFLSGRFPVVSHTGLNFVDVRDVALGHLLALHRGISGQRYLLGCQNLWLRQFLQKVEPYGRYRAPKVVAPYWACRLVAEISERASHHYRREPAAAIEAVRTSRYCLFFDSSKAIAELGYAPRGIDEAIRDAVTYFREHALIPA